jgi:hypothetical protein
VRSVHPLGRLEALRKAFVALLFAIAFVPALLVVAFGTNAFLDSRAGRAFGSVEMGATEAQVRSLMGRPSVENDCGENLWSGGDSNFLGKNDGRCLKEVRYEYFLSAWAFGYSADRHVVSKYHYFSE